MTDNLRHWNRFADIDPKFTKAITGKQYKGTSPNPQYVIKCLTEIFGPVGEGFGWHVAREEFTPLGDEVLHWCRIEFWHGSRENRFDSYGQTKALMKTKSGLMSDEDAPKKSLTDAIIKAASHIGIASNIFLGRWDDQKYVESVNQDYRAAERDEQNPPFNARAAADHIIIALGKRSTVSDITELWNAEKQTMGEIKAANKAIFDEVSTQFKHAGEEAKAKEAA